MKEKHKLMRERLKWWNKEVFGWLDLTIEKLVADMDAIGCIAAKGEELGDVIKHKEISTSFW